MPAKLKFPTTSTARAPKKVFDLMRINSHFRRSIQVELDFNDPNSTSGYVATEFVVNSFERIRPAFTKGSTQRSWRITGDYGSGKSAFVLNLAKAVCGRPKEIPSPLRNRVFGDLDPVFVTGEREPLHESIGKAVIKQSPWMSRRAVPTNSTELITLLEDAHKLSKKGLFLVLDELGKNLEQAMMEPASSDVYILQRLAELAARSGDKPFVVIAILHMGISAYTSDLDTTTRREWDKVAGRFDELQFQHPFEQTVQLCAEAIGLNTDALPKNFTQEAASAMTWAVENGMYGSSTAHTLKETAPKIFPLHPVALPPLVFLLRRFSQNERSLFSFLSGHEPSALQEVANLDLDNARFFRLSDLYDYVSKNIAHTMTNGRATHWKIIESVVRKVENLEYKTLLKSIGVLNLIDETDMPATRELLSKAYGTSSPKDEVHLTRLIEELKDKRLLYERGAVRSLALWPHTSVHLDDAFEEAQRDLGEPAQPMRLVASKLGPRQIVARRHYIETGNLRHFELQFMPAGDFDRLCEVGPQPHLGNADGFVIILLPENEREHRQIQEKLKSGTVSPAPSVLVGLTRPPIHLLGTCKDLQVWEHVQTTVKELASDEFARRELRAQIRTANERLGEQIDALVGWNDVSGSVQWFRNGTPAQLDTSGLGGTLSHIAQDLYGQCPKITNELINRRITSSAASRARTALVDSIAKNPDKTILGMDDSKNPPEMAIYLSVLKAGKLHIQDESGWKFVIPEKGEDDPCRLRPAFKAIEKILMDHDAQRVKIPVILEKLRSAPIGARDGLIPLILALYMAARRNQTALFEESTYLPSLDGDIMQRLTKEPEAFELQHCAIEGSKMEIFDAIAKVFKIERSDDPQVLDVVRPLMQFVAELPEYSRHTKKLSADAVKIRNILLTARDPVQLVFQDLPNALSATALTKEILGVKVTKLISELSNSYDALLARLAASITEAFGTTTPAAKFRKELISRAKAISGKLVESDLKAFVLRMGDSALEDRQWLESLANHLSKKSASRWIDSDEEVFNQRLIILAQRMLRAEAAQGDITKKHADGTGERAVRLILTRPDGGEQGELLHWSEDEDSKVNDIAEQIAKLIKSNGRAGLGAAAKAIWQQLERL